AARYFLPEEAPPAAADDIGARWVKAKSVQAAIAKQSHGEWAALDPADRIKAALDKHYNEMAYYLFSNNYSELEGAKKSKADSCREALERKLAGMAGKMDALARFYTEQLEKQHKAKGAAAH